MYYLLKIIANSAVKNGLTSINDTSFSNVIEDRCRNSNNHL